VVNSARVLSVCKDSTDSSTAVRKVVMLMMSNMPFWDRARLRRCPPTFWMRRTLLRMSPILSSIRPHSLRIAGLSRLIRSSQSRWLIENPTMLKTISKSRMTKAQVHRAGSCVRLLV
jgi:hypothetical protein